MQKEKRKTVVTKDLTAKAKDLIAKAKAMKSVRNFFSNRIVNLWNNLPSSTTDFTSFRRFNKSLSNDYLLLHCTLNFR